MSRMTSGRDIRIPYDKTSPFGTYRLSEKDEFVYKLFQNNLLPRDIVFKTFFRRSMQNYKSGILDVTIHGISMRIKPETNISEAAFLRRGVHADSVEIKFLEKECKAKSNPVFVDIGANIGLYSLILSRKLPNLRVLSIEPHPGISKQLEYNLELNPDLNISVHKLAVSDHAGMVRMQTDLENLGSSRVEDSGDIEVECTTLNSIVEKLCPSGMDALKIDVEGCEDKVLIPYLQNVSPSKYPRTIVLELSPQIWEKDPINVAISKGYKEVKRNRMNSILVHQDIA